MFELGLKNCFILVNLLLLASVLERYNYITYDLYFSIFAIGYILIAVSLLLMIKSITE